MIARHVAAVALGIGLVAPVVEPVLAADQPVPAADKPVPAADEPAEGYDLSTSITTGYRTVDVDGSKDKYREDYNLRSGGRLFTLTADGSARNPDVSPVDRLSLVIDHPGDEPVSTFHLSAVDLRDWDFRADFVRSKYYYAVPQLFENPVPDDGRTDDLHTFDQIRTNGSVDFRLHRDGMPTLILGYRLYRLEGDAVSTELAPDGTTVLVHAPADTRANVGRIGTEFRALGTDVSLVQEYRQVIRDLGLHGPVADPPVGIDPSDPTTLTRADSAGSEHIGAPTTIARVRRSFGDALEVNGIYLYSHASLDSNWTDRTFTTEDTGAHTRARSVSSGSATLSTNIVDLGATYRLSDRARLHLSYRFDERAQSGEQDQQSGASVFSVGTGDHLRLNRTTLDIEVDPRRDLNVRLGLRYAWRDANISSGGVGPITTQTLGAIADVRYRPHSAVDLFARYESAQVDDPYRSAGDPNGQPIIPGREIELTFRNRGSAGATVRPWKWMRLAYRFIADSRENSSFDARSLAFGNSASIVLTPIDALSVSASYARRDLDDSADILLAPAFTTATSLQQGSEDIVASQMSYDFGLVGQRWSTGWSVSWTSSNQTLRPRLETGGGTRTHFDLSRIDAGAFLTWHHRWLEPGIAVRRIQYSEPTLPANDYDATIVELTVSRRFDLVLP